MKYLSIADTEISYSREFGIKLQQRSGKISICQSKIISNVKGGVLIAGSWLKYLSIVDTEISYSREFGIKLQQSGIDSVQISSVNLEQNKLGLLIHPMSFSEFTIENCVINGSLRQGVYVYSGSTGIMRIVNSRVTSSGDRGLTIEGRYRHMRTSLFVNSTTFAWNKMGAVSYTNSYASDHVTIQFESSNFLRNEGPTVEIFEATYRTTWKFLNNTFHENHGFAVIAIGTSSLTGSQFRPTMVVRGNRFLSNQCPDKAVIDIRRDSSDFLIMENVFEFNVGSCVLLEGTAAYVPVTITDNVFNENECEDKSVIEALRLDEKAQFVNNSFTQNRAQSVILMQVIHNIDSTLHSKELAFRNNTLSKNTPYNVTQPLVVDSNNNNNNRNNSKGESCAFVLSGILYYKDTDFSLNKFNNSNYLTELCVRVPAISQRDVVNVTHNWWGTTIGSGVRDRIWDFDDNYDFAIASDWPFLLRNDDASFISLEEQDFEQHGTVLSGRLFESLTLREFQSPYSVTSDFTVLENVTLIVEAGVTISVAPSVSILVAGVLHARGTLDKPVVFTVKEPVKSKGASHLVVRLVDGSFPWEGWVEVLHSNSWKPVSASDNTPSRNLTGVICRQLGYDSPFNPIDTENKATRNVNGSWVMELHCRGNETFLHECSFNQRALNYSRRLPSIHVKCQSTSWGNVRFVTTKVENSTQKRSSLEHVEFSYCGNRHGNSVPAIEAEANVPKLRFITVRNCTSGGLRIHAPETDVHVNNSAFVNSGKTGLSFLQTQRNIIVENSESTTNDRGISFEEARLNNVPQVHYARVFLCSDDKSVLLQNQTLLYFKIPRLKNTKSSESCQKVLKVPKGRGIKITLLNFRGTQRLQVYSSSITRNIIVDKSTRDLNTLVHKELFIPRDTLLVKWTGHVNSEVLIQVQDMDIEGEYLCQCVCVFEGK